MTVCTSLATHDGSKGIEMSYKTVPHRWMETLSDDPVRVVRGCGLPNDGQTVLVASPTLWSQRISAWLEGMVLTVGEDAGNAYHLATKPPDRRLRLPLPDDLAVIVMSGQGEGYAYSHRAVFSAGQAMQAFGITRVVDAPAAISWWNGWPWTEGSDERWTPKPSSIAGCLAFGQGNCVVYWHPTILGPMMMQDGHGIRHWAPELAGSIEGSLAIRGEAVPQGRWTGREVVPIAFPGGWWLANPPV